MGDFPTNNHRAPDEIRLFRPLRGPKNFYSQKLLFKFADNGQFYKCLGAENWLYWNFCPICLGQLGEALYA